MSELTDAIKSVVAAINRAVGKPAPAITVSAPAVPSPAVHVAVPEPRRAKGFTLKIKERDAEGHISVAECTFNW